MRLMEFNEKDLRKMSAEELIKLAEDQVVEMINLTDEFIKDEKFRESDKTDVSEFRIN